MLFGVYAGIIFLCQAAFFLRLTFTTPILFYQKHFGVWLFQSARVLGLEAVPKQPVRGHGGRWPWPLFCLSRFEVSLVSNVFDLDLKFVLDLNMWEILRTFCGNFAEICRTANFQGSLPIRPFASEFVSGARREAMQVRCRTVTGLGAPLHKEMQHDQNFKDSNSIPLIHLNSFGYKRSESKSEMLRTSTSDLLRAKRTCHNLELGCFFHFFPV